MRWGKSDRRSAVSSELATEHGPPHVPYPIHRLTIDHEHRPPLGEDARPIWVFVPPMHGLIGVFDGLGGAGGEPVSTPKGVHTGAWVAARLARKIAIKVHRELVIRAHGACWAGNDDLYDQTIDLPEFDQPFDFTAELRQALQAGFVKAAADFGAGGSLLKSRMIKILPTTLAICAYDFESNEAAAIWAGDSRIYHLGPEAGLQQITTDDLKSNADALENLTQDSPMSNCVSADTDFVLHERRLPLRPPAILIAASDGCFGYVQTPQHFEYMLLSTMQNAASWSSWQTLLQAEIERVTSDDSTLSAVAVGWQDFATCKRAFVTRSRVCERRHKAYEDLRLRVAALDQDLEQARADLAASTRMLWESYRLTYEDLAKVPTRDVPDRGVGDAPADGGAAR